MRRPIVLTYTVVGRGGDAVQVLAMIEAISRLGWEVFPVGAQAVQPYDFSSRASDVRRLAKTLPWRLRGLVEAATGLYVALRALLVASRVRPAMILDRIAPYSVAGVVAARLAGVPVAIHLDAPFAVELPWLRKGLAAWSHRLLMRFAGGAASIILVNSKASEAHFAAMGLPRDRIRIIHNGVFAEDLVAEPPAPRTVPTIGYVGSMAPWHRVDLLLEALRLLRGAGMPATLTVVGTGEDHARIFRRTAALELTDSVRFTGPVRRPDALKLIDDLSVAVLPNTLGTGSPMKLFEYAARGIPMVAPDLPNLRETWGDEALTYFRPGDESALARAIRRLLEDPAGAHRQAQAALDLVRERHTWEHQMEYVLGAMGLTGMPA